MMFSALLARVGELPIIDSKTLRTWGEDPHALSVQLSRWTKAGKLVPLRRGVYLLPSSLRRTYPPLEYIANLLVVPSYISLERALAFYGLIPESVPLVQSVTLRRPACFRTAAGDFAYHHVKKNWFFGYLQLAVPPGSALIARPEKALLDLLYLSPGPLSLERLEGLRLQGTSRLSIQRILAYARGQGDRIERAANVLTDWLRSQKRRR